MAALLLCAAPPVLGARYYEYYERGEEALKAGNWNEAISQFNQAIGEEQQPKVGARTYGMNFINYHPYFKLGVAYFHLGEFERATQAFDTEEAFGEIQKSASDLESLKDYRGRVQAGRDEAAAAEQARIAGLVANSLRKARGLADAGRLDEAMAELGNALALDPQNAEADAAMQRIRRRVADEQRQAEAATRVADLVDRGRGLVDAGSYQEAGSVLNQALEIDPGNADALALLNDAQTRLRERIQAQQDAQAQAALIAGALRDARDREGRGELDGALESLQSVLALEPDNADALAIQNRVLQAQSAAASAKSLSAEVGRLLAEGRGFLDAKDYGQAVSTLNRVLALAPDNGQARTLLAGAFQGISEGVRGSGSAVASFIAPIIKIINAANTEEGVEEVSSPLFTLRGIVIAAAPEIEGVVQLMRGDQQVGEAPITVDSSTNVGALYTYVLHADVSLPTGDSSLRVAVKDLYGQSSEVAHPARYLRPWYLSPVFLAGIALAVVLAIVLYVLRRVQRRNRLLKRRFNPYMAGAPVMRDDLFLGREGLLSRILQTVHNNSILLFGERRIGKTSLQHHLKKRLEELKDPDYQFFPVYIDLQGTPQERFFGTLGHDILEQLGPLLDGAPVGREVPEPDEYTYQNLVRDLRGVIKALKERTDKKIKVVLLIDEVDELNDYDPKVNQKLRSLFMKNMAESLVSVVSGVGIKKKWESEGSPWYNFFEEIEVEPFTEKDAEDLICRPIKGVFALEDGVVDSIIKITDCKPYRIQKMCIALVNRLHEERRRKITVADVSSVKHVGEG